MNKRRLISPICTFSACVFCLTGTASATSQASSGQANVTRYQQEKSNWCWVACAKMIGQHMLGESESQTSIYMNTKMTNVVENKSATNTEMTKAINYVLDNQYYADYANGTVSLSYIKGSILSDQPLVFKFYSSGYVAHAVVVDAFSQNNIRIVDPAVGCSSKIFVDYDQAKISVNLLSGRKQWVDTWSISDTYNW